MASRVYWKSLRLVLHRAEAYIQRWDTRLEENLTPEQWACVGDVLAAILSCLALLPVNDPQE